ncbi:MAG TPA: O-succinylhomoserine sulfhydrylase [Nocardioidaceae bacterium]|nr:O-succinylhomoserine sulfhydrylase [Nocardioidaceae bacterium]
MNAYYGPRPAWRPDTVAVRGGLYRSELDETAEALFLTSGYVYSSAAEAEAAFKGESDHYIYSRFGNPTVDAFGDRMKLLEGAESCFPTASGMAAVFNSLLALVRAGDRVVASRSLFGSCFAILDDLLPRWGVITEFVDGHDLDQWEKALARPAEAVFFESPSNPMQELIDVRRVCELAHAAGAKVIVDNVFATSVLQRPLDLGADIVVYSATKHIDGQGRTLGGAILGPVDYIEGEVKTLMRNTGPSLSPFNAWVLTKGLETLAMRVRHSTAGAERIAAWLEQHPRVNRVLYPWLESHPQHALAKQQMTGGGTVVTFEVDGGKEQAFAVLDRLRIIDISNNLGDSKSLVTHPATTTHHRMGPEGRARVGITDGLVRISVGLEDVEDLLEDLDQALSA